MSVLGEGTSTSSADWHGDIAIDVDDHLSIPIVGKVLLRRSSMHRSCVHTSPVAPSRYGEGRCEDRLEVSGRRDRSTSRSRPSPRTSSSHRRIWRPSTLCLPTRHRYGDLTPRVCRRRKEVRHDQDRLPPSGAKLTSTRRRVDTRQGETDGTDAGPGCGARHRLDGPRDGDECFARRHPDDRLEP